ncbi:MAG: dTDP-4-dehydrorhamnose reductase [Acidobacteria bacterium]|nr:MAG: dTDP-4-dehydrorhamnose reductase [Acidobacteriota bacterium]
MTEILITGNQGQLGRAVERLAAKRGLSVSGSDLDSLDITSAFQVEQWIATHQPRTVINCAAFTAVDDCETKEDEAESINGTAVGYLAEACHGCGARLIHVSTDYVFDGTKTTPYVESDPTEPTSAYGRTKLAGERLAASVPDHVIVRTAWLYGLGGRNFVEAIRRQIDGGAKELKVVADQHGCPTFCDDLATALLDLAKVEAHGIIHAVNSGDTTWHGFASEVARILGSSIPIEAVTTQAFLRPAPRPAYSVLDTTRLQTLRGRPMPTWQDALARYLQS